MNLGRAGRWAGLGLLCIGVVCAFQKPFRQYPGVEYSQFQLTPDWQEKTEFAFARLMFPPGPLNGYRGRDADWHTGISLWTQDYPRADRHFAQAVRRLTRIHVRSVEQPVNLEEGEAWDEPWLYAFERVVPALLRKFKPTVLVTQDGCDSHYLDPLAHLATHD